MKVYAPPIKSQGIKTKLVPWIRCTVPADFCGRWVEPFMGTGAVAFNLAPKRALLCDANPHLINFYQAVSGGGITPGIVREFLSEEGANLLKKGESHYYELRDRFNREHNPLDFLFLNRAGFNGMIRFNQKGALNIPFCKKPNRFVNAYVTKISNQVAHVTRLLQMNEFVFKRQSFEKTMSACQETDVIYCDPPYIDRHADYYNAWRRQDEMKLHTLLAHSPSRFILSTWHHNAHRKNQYIDSLWKNFHIETHEHFYHVGGSEENRNSMTEALVTNYGHPSSNVTLHEKKEQLALFEPRT